MNLRCLAVLILLTGSMSVGVFAQVQSDLEKRFIPKDEFPKNGTWINTDFPISNAQLKNKVLVVNFFGEDCPACSEGLHLLEEFAAKFVQVQLITVMQCDSNKIPGNEELKNFLWKNSITHPLVLVNDYSSFAMSKPQSLPFYTVSLDPGKPMKMGNDVDEILALLNGLGEALHTPDAKLGMTATRYESNLLLSEYAEPLLKFPEYIDVHDNDRQFFISDGGHHRVLLADNDGEINISIGSAAPGYRDGTFYESSFRYPGGIAYDEKNDRLYIADTENHRIRYADMKGRTVGTLCGNGSRIMDGESTRIDGINGAVGLPVDVAFMNDNLYFISAADNGLYKVIPSTGVANLVIRFSSRLNSAGIPAVPIHLSMDGENKLLFVTESDGAVYAVDGDGITSMVAGSSSDDIYIRSSLRKAGTYYYSEPARNRITLRGDRSGQVGGNYAGFRNAKSTKAWMQHPRDLDWMSGQLVIADSYNNAIRTVRTKKKKVSSMELRPAEQIMRTGDASKVGEYVFLPQIETGPGINTITITIDAGQYRVYPGGLNEVHSDGVSGVTVKSFNAAAGQVILELDPKESNGSIMLEFFFSVEHPDQPGAWLLKSSFITIPVELSGAGPTEHSLDYEVSIAAKWNPRFSRK